MKCAVRAAGGATEMMPLASLVFGRSEVCLMKGDDGWYRLYVGEAWGICNSDLRFTCLEAESARKAFNDEVMRLLKIGEFCG
jgi:hypothetical protein